MVMLVYVHQKKNHKEMNITINKFCSPIKELCMFMFTAKFLMGNGIHR